MFLSKTRDADYMDFQLPAEFFGWGAQTWGCVTLLMLENTERLGICHTTSDRA